MQLKRRNKASAEFSMASMTDIIFLLLIFFMITSSAISQSAIEVDLPKADSSAPSISEQAVVSVSPQGAYFLNDVPVPKDLLEKEISSRLQMEKNPILTIRADEATPHGDVVFLMDIAKKHQFAVSLATISSQ